MNKYTKGKVSLYQGDCMDLMESKPDNYYDLAVVDPPYGLGDKVVNSGGRFARYRNDKGNWDINPPPPDYFDLLQRKSKNQIIFGANHFIDNFPFMCNSSCWIIWDKKQPEGISFASSELAWTSFNSVVKTFYSHPQHKNKNRIVPTQKPVKLYDWIFHNYAKPDFKILDSHGGSFSSAISGYYFLNDDGLMDIIELDKDYYNDAVKRFKEMTRQTKLF